MKVHAVVAGWMEQIAACNGPSVSCPEPSLPSGAQLDEMVAVWGYAESRDELTTIIKAKARKGEDEFDWFRHRLAKRHKAETRRLLIGDFDGWHNIAQNEFQRRGWDIPSDGPEFHEFCSKFARAAVDVYAHGLALMDGHGDKFEPSVATQGLLKEVKQRAQSGEDILGLYDRYSAQRLAEGKKRKDTLAQDRKAVQSFAEFVGKSRSLRSVTADEVRRWRNAMAALPTCYKKHKVYAGMSMQEAADYATKTNAKRVSLITVNKNLSAISSLFIWAKREGYADANPCDGLRYDADKRKNPRPPFDTAQLNRILRSPLFTGFQSDGKEHLPGSQRTRDWRFWIPLVCLFTGARIGEIAQLHVDDLDRQDDHWFLHIRNDEGKGQQTKSGLSRPAPIHSQLEKIGFIDFVQDQKRKAVVTGDEKLFPELSVNDRGQNGYASRFWRTYLQRIGVKKGGDGLGAHSFRHGLADQLRLAGYFDRDIEVVLGHNQASVTSGYGKLRQGTVARLSEMIEGAKFERVEFSHLIQ